MNLSSPTQSTNIYIVWFQNPKGNQQPGGNKRNNCNNNHKCGNNNNNNKIKDDHDHDKYNNNSSEGKKENRKVKFPCKFCKEYHFTHLCPKIEESSRLIAQEPAVLTNSFTHNQNMTPRDSTPKIHRVEVKIP
jgi:hypothetical protein